MKDIKLSVDEISDIEECLYLLEDSSLVRLDEDRLERKLEDSIPDVLNRWEVKLLAIRGNNTIGVLKNIINKYYDGKENEIKSKAQEEYCKENRCPHFAPRDICFRCNNHIYEHISLRKASNELITGCPCCSWSYCD